MMVPTTSGVPVSKEMVSNYFRTLVNLFFKILPLWENGESSLPVYILNLQQELLGCGSLIEELGADPSFLSLTAMLQFLLDNPGATNKTVKRHVFRAISVCNYLKSRYAKLGEGAEE